MGQAVKHSDAEQGILRQVLVDLPRTTPKLRMIHLEPLQRVSTRGAAKAGNRFQFPSLCLLLSACGGAAEP